MARLTSRLIHCRTVLVAVSLFSTTVFADSTTAFFDPSPSQAEASIAEVESRAEAQAKVAIPHEKFSFFAVAGFNNSSSDDYAANGDAGLSFCHTEKWSRSCLYGLLVYRCGQYTYPFTPYGCAAVTAAFVTELDMKRIDVESNDQVYNLPVIFVGRLEKLIQDPTVQTDLATLRIMLENSIQTKEKLNLYEWVRGMQLGNSEATLEKLAVLFQDTSAVAIQINYLQGIQKSRRFNATTLKAIENLDELNYLLNDQNLKDVDWKSWLTLYPNIPNLEKEVTPQFYHFYPMAYLAKRLQRKGFGSRLSSFIPFLFNTEYGSQTLDPARWPLHHPKPFPINTPLRVRKMQHVYEGYAGALWGVGRTKVLKGLGPFQADYAKAPYEYMRYLYWTFR